jgi:8-oxo-dGTP pyrophosphatase MutT (NUDIX family)
MPHIHEKIDFTVEVFVVFKNKVLLRFHDKYNIWLSVGGHIELDEDPNQAAIREVKEEVGLDVTLSSSQQQFMYRDDQFVELIPPHGMNRHRISPTHEHVTMVFFGTATSDVVKVEYEGDKSDDWKWLSKEELDSLDLKPDVKFWATKALEELGNN